MGKPLVSVHVITYNHERWIRKCIESMLSQKTDFNIEVIIGEDNSTDQTKSIIREYLQSGRIAVKMITSAKNVGSFVNAKRVLKACQGEYVAFLEGDDYWNDPLNLAKQVEFLKKPPGAWNGSYKLL